MVNEFVDMVSNPDYLLFVLLGLLILTPATSYIATRLWGKPGYSFDEKLLVLALAPTIGPILEEGLFRWLPLVFFGPIGAIVGSVLFVFGHHPKHWIPISIVGAALCYFWIIGLGWLAILIHYANNILGCILLACKDEDIKPFLRGRFKED